MRTLRGVIAVVAAFVVFVFILTGCSSKETEFLGFQDIETQVEGKNIKIDVENGMDEFNFGNTINISAKASYEVYEDAEMTKSVVITGLLEGQNIFYLKVLAENKKDFNVYEVTIYREISYGLSYSEGRGYQIRTPNNELLPRRVNEKTNLNFLVIVEEEYNGDYLVIVNGVEVEAQLEIYTIQNINEDIDIEVVNIHKNYQLINYDLIQTGYRLLNIDNTPFDIENIKYGESISFKILKDEGYSESITVVNNDNILTAVDEVYKIENIKEDVNLVITDLSKISYLISFPLNQEVYKITNEDGSDFVIFNIEHGDDASFKIELQEGYSDCVAYANKIVINKNNGIYTISNITSDFNIEINNFSKLQYEITLPDINEGYYIIDREDIPNSVEYGDSISFRIEIEVGYDGEVVVKNNNDIIYAEDDYYFITYITDNVEITIEGIYKRMYSLTLPSIQEGYKIINLDGSDFENINVEYGESISFKIKIKEGYEEEAAVRSNQTVLNKVEGIYTILNIISFVDVVVYGVELKTLIITYPQTNELFTFINNEYNLKYNSDLIFQIEFVEGYILNDVILKVNNKVVVGVKDENNDLLYAYSFKNLTEDAVIKIENLNEKYWDLNYVTSIGYNFDLSNPSQVQESKFAYFEFHLDQDYYLINVTINNQELFDGCERMDTNWYRCLIENVRSNVEIKVFVTQETFIISYESEEGYELVEIEGYDFQKVPFDYDFVFKVEIKEGYEADNNFKVFILEGNTILFPNENDFYTINNVKQDIYVSISGVVAIIFKAQVNEGEFEVANINDDILYGSDFSFTIDILPGYQAPNIEVWIDDNQVMLIDEEYTIYNVKNNLNIKVYNIEKTLLNINYPEGEGYFITDFEEKLDLQITVESYSTFFFHINIEEDYYIDDLIIKVNGVITDNRNYENDIVWCWVETGYSDIVITIEGIKIVPYSIRFENFFVANIYNEFEQQVPIEYNFDETDILRLKMSVNDGYDEKEGGLCFFNLNLEQQLICAGLDGYFEIPITNRTNSIEITNYTLQKRNLTFIYNEGEFLDYGGNEYVVEINYGEYLYIENLLEGLLDESLEYYYFLDEKHTQQVWNYLLLINGNKNIYIVERKTQFTITFNYLIQDEIPFTIDIDSNSGNNYNLIYNHLANKPIKEGYFLFGWSIIESGNPQECMSVTELLFKYRDIIVYAVWVEEFEIIFDLKGHGNAKDNLQINKDFDENDILILVNEPKENGFIFKFWYVEDEDQQIICIDLYNLKNLLQTTTIFAYWIEDYYLVFDTGEITLDNPMIDFKVNGNTSNESSYKTFLELNLVPYATGYLFAGWFTSPNYEEYTRCYYFNEILDLNPFDVLYAKWIKIEILESEDWVIGNWFAIESVGHEYYLQIKQNGKAFLYIKDQEDYWNQDEFKNYFVYKNSNNRYFLYDEKTNDIKEICFYDNSISIQHLLFSRQTKQIVKYVFEGEHFSNFVKYDFVEMGSLIEQPFNEHIEINYWYFDKEKNILWDFENDFLETEILVLYGREKMIMDITVIFNDIEGSSSFDNIIVNNLFLNENISLPVPSREGYIFIGWFYGDVNANLEFWFIIEETKTNILILESRYIETIDYENQDIIGIYVYESEGYITEYEFRSDGGFYVVIYYEGEFVESILVYWRINYMFGDKMFEYAIIANYAETFEVEFFKGSTKIEDYILIFGDRFDRKPIVN